ncbi:NAD-dependent malic enzyme [Heliobacterium undosum]|uniref:NAD-dependent malic enzyme n=1 Tax=Heliomicrobium undosum TaxID=121734 RepID=A0A845LBN0_9FIRM|nr:NAD-dependent malic enzyme [Heliomicrobium undosum]MZP30331.1 NAD-dependent malic enzyme [Heliomicrobium undosum]
MSIAVNVLLRLKLENQPGMLAQVLSIIAAHEGHPGSIDLVSASTTHVIRELMVRLHDSRAFERLLAELRETPGVQVIRVADRVFLRHVGGKIEVRSRCPVANREDLSLIYTPGVGAISELIAREPDMAFPLTMKGNAIAIVTDGSAVLGLGDLGPAAALPVMEGKAVLFKRFAGINAVPICLDVHEPQAIIDAVRAIAPAFGGINLEDIAAPKCFEIEQRLSEILDIPVFHDDQHGTAIVTLAGLLNALKVVGKELAQARIVIAGAGAAGMAITAMLLKAGATDLIVCDRKGAISRDEGPSQPSKRWIAEHTNAGCVKGPLKKVVAGADVFIGVSGPGVLDRADVETMAARPVIFALANPEPEIEPETVHDIAGVIATGRSDYPNQINNALAFPGIFRGALDCHARTISDEMSLAAAYALAGLVPEEELSAEHIIPSIFHEEVASVVARAVVEVARRTGVARPTPHGPGEE